MKRCTLLFALLIASLSIETASGQFNDLLVRVPGQANTIVILNVDKIHATPLATKENWREQQEKAFAAGLTILPPQASQFVMGAQMDFEFMQASWETSLAKVRYEPSMPKVATRWNGTIDRFGTRNAVLLPDDTYVVQFGKSIVGAMRPANRQTVARWLSQIDGSGGERGLSTYLNEAASFAEKNGTPIIMALDLQDVVSPDLLRDRLGSAEFLKGSTIDKDQLVAALSSIRGVTLGITIRDRVYGAIKVDFEKKVGFIGDLAKPMLLAALADHSAMIDEFEEWEPKVAGKQIQIGGYLEESGLRRILSVLDTPPALQEEVTQPVDPNQSEQATRKFASQQYFRSVVGQVDTLRGRDKQTMGQVGVWCGRYARKIDQLPMLNVDEELIEYGAFVSSALRQAEAVLRGVGGRTRVRQLNSSVNSGSSYSYGYGYSNGRWGAYGRYGGVRGQARAEQQERTAVRTQERVAGATSGRDIMQQIDAATADVRRAMTRKYQVEF